MSLRSAPFWWLECDRCGVKSTEDSDYTAWADHGQAFDEARESDWYVGDDGHLCRDCTPHPPDWDDEHATAFRGEAELVCGFCAVGAEGN